MSSTKAIVEANKLWQKEDEHIRIYASQFEELRRFFKECIDNRNCIEMFMGHVREPMRVHAVSLAQENLEW